MNSLTVHILRFTKILSLGERGPAMHRFLEGVLNVDGKQSKFRRGCIKEMIFDPSGDACFSFAVHGLQNEIIPSLKY